MISHKLTPEQQEYQKLARDFATREIAAQAPKYDQSADFAGDIFAKLWQTGLANAAVPEPLNGLGLSCFDNCLIAEELACGCSGIAGSVEASSIAQQFVIDFGSDEQKSKFLSPLIDEACLAGFGMSGGIKSGRVFYRKEGEQFVLSGKHPALVNAGIAQWYLVAASGDRREVTNGGRELDSKERFSYFLVGADDDIDFGERAPSLGRRAQVISSARLDEVYLPASALLGNEGDGEQMYRLALTRNYALIAAGMVGVARSALEHALKYAKERMTFGVAIAQHQAISFMLADMAKDIEAARLLVYQAAQLADQGVVSTTEAVCAKAFAQEMVMRVTTDAVQIFGGYGFSREYPVEKLMRDAKAYQLFEHTSEGLKVEMGRHLVTAV
ncbi:acyl-CoA dehydrogenase family protein [bacterium]|nr:acyl-CoA dehydrogenase family protein [bacterium]MBP9808453.1 acyl-CoA dehydrogenase family protein [bacterium]